MMSLISPVWITKGFESTGLYPLNKDRVTMHNFNEAFYHTVGANASPDESQDAQNTTINLQDVSTSRNLDETVTSPRLTTPEVDITEQCIQSQNSLSPSAVNMSSDDFELNFNHQNSSSTNSSKALLTGTRTVSNGLFDTYSELTSMEAIPSTSYTDELEKTVYQCIEDISIPQTLSGVANQDDGNLDQQPVSTITSKILPFKLASSKYSISTPYDQFVKIVGAKQIKVYESESYESDLAQAAKVLPADLFTMMKNQFETYKMLKEYNEFLRTPATLPKPKPVKRKGKKTNVEKKSFILTSEDWITKTEMETNKKKKEIEEKEIRKRIREENKVTNNIKKKKKTQPLSEFNVLESEHK